MNFPYGETVEVLTAATSNDPYSGDPVPDWTLPPASSVEIPGCGVADGGSLEPLQDARNAVISDFDVIMPPGTAVTRTNRLIIRGLTCEVAGRPFEWMNPFTGWTPGLIVRATIAEG